jgi:hypothetical protein
LFLRERDRARALFYEDRVASFADLAKRLRGLDQDSGVRLVGGSGSSRFLVFVTRFGPKYTVMTYTMGRNGTPGNRLETLDFEGLKDLEGALRALVKDPLRAWVY